MAIDLQSLYSDTDKVVEHGVEWRFRKMLTMADWEKIQAVIDENVWTRVLQYHTVRQMLINIQYQGEVKTAGEFTEEDWSAMPLAVILAIYDKIDIGESPLSITARIEALEGGLQRMMTTLGLDWTSTPLQE